MSHIFKTLLYVKEDINLFNYSIQNQNIQKMYSILCIYVNYFFYGYCLLRSNSLFIFTKL